MTPRGFQRHAFQHNAFQVRQSAVGLPPGYGSPHNRTRTLKRMARSNRTIWLTLAFLLLF